MEQETKLDLAYEIFLLDCEARGLTSSTINFYRVRLGLFLKWCEITGLSELNANHIRFYLAHLQQRKLSSVYIHGQARAIRTWLNFCVRDGLIEHSPFDAVTMPRQSKKILSALSSEDIRKILGACRYDRDTALVMLLLDSGVRAAECIALDVGDIDIKSGTVTVHDGKGQKGRTTQIGAKTRKAILRYFATERSGVPISQAPLFTSLKTGNRLTYHGLRQALNRLGQKTDVPVTAHGLRRTFAITCLRNGMNVHVLARILGHADIQVLRQYLDLLEDDLRNAHAQYGPVDNL